MKKFIITLTIISLLICSVNINKVYAIAETVGGIDSALSLLSQAETLDNQQAFVDGWNMLLQSSGFMSDYITSTSLGAVLNTLSYVQSNNLQNASTQEKIDAVCDYILNGGLAEDSQGVYVGDDTYKQMIKDTKNYIVSQTQYYVGYSYDLVGNSQYFGTRFNALCDIVQELQNDYVCVIYGNNLLCIPKGNYVLMNNSYTTDYFVVFRKIAENNLVQINWNSTGNKQYIFNGTDEFVLQNSVNLNSQAGSFLDSDKTENVGYSNFNAGYQYVITYDKRDEYVIYLNQNGITENGGNAPYYYNNEVWENFDNSVGDYSYNSSNINTVSFGDIVSYVNNYESENGYRPNLGDINLHITIQNNENIENGSGSGDDNGNGGGSDNDSGSIFDWLKALGKVLGDLIKGVGEFLTEIVTGLVSAITDLLTSLGTLISDITQAIPAVFTDFLGALLGWLPSELQALISLGIVAMVLVGIIKLIRGS